MSLIKFTLTEEHIKLVKQMKFGVKTTSDNVVIPAIEDELFGSDTIYDDVYLILYGKPKDEKVTEPWDEQVNVWTDEELEHMKELLNGLDNALSIILSTGSFEPGEYKTKSYITDWKKI